MAQKDASTDEIAKRVPAKETSVPNGTTHLAPAQPKDYSSHGVTDNDIFMLPRSDFQLLGLLTAIAALVRLFRIYQPSSVVFDEVQ